MPMTPDAKRALSTTIRALRTRLLTDLESATESAYRFSVRAESAGLDEATKKNRARFEGWLKEQLAAERKSKGKAGRTAEDFRREAEKQAAYTLLNRLLLLRLLEEPGPDGTALRRTAVLTRGWDSPGYKEFRAVAPALVRGDETEGYAFLLRLVFEDLATDLPGLYGPAGVADLVPVPTGTLRHVVDALNAKELSSCWSDDMTLGWVYQYWNDPEREALDAKLNPKTKWGSGKIEPHEIASKTQMFTERYMVDWLLQNSLGPMWLSMCRKHGWTPAVEADGTLSALEARRAGFRAQREAGLVALTALMPLYTEAERRWAYYVPQEIPEDAVQRAPESVRTLRVLDPAVGSGHFLVVALDLLVALYREEAQHRGEVGQEAWSDRAIVERILEHNLHGIDLDRRAVQIAAAALWLKAQQVAAGARPGRLHLVAANLRLGGLPDDDPALVELRRAVEQETGIPGGVTDTLVRALRGADHLGSLLKVDKAVEEALDECESKLGRVVPEQLELPGKPAEKRDRKAISREQARATLVGRIEQFLGKHTSADDLGLRLRGEQLAAGVRFIRMVHPGSYDLVVANPPYLGASRMTDAKYVEVHYPAGKADLYAAFLLRGLELARSGGVSSMLTMRNWMFIKQYAGLREHLLESYDLRTLGDFDRGGFEDVPGEVVSVAVAAFARCAPNGKSVAVCPTAREDHSRYADRTARKRAATLCHVGHQAFDPVALKVVPQWPLIHWWGQEFLREYAKSAKVGDRAGIREGLGTKNDPRYLKAWWEVQFADTMLQSFASHRAWDGSRWVPFIKGAEGRQWFDAVRDVVNWRHAGIEIATYAKSRFGRGATFYFRQGIAFVMIGSGFGARAHRFPSIFGHMGGSTFPDNIAGTLCSLNAARSKDIASALNPSLHFLVGDVNRLPLFPIADADKIFAQIESAFTTHESHREPSTEYKEPGPSPWRHAQEWAQTAVDRPEGAPLPDYREELDPEPATDHLSFALGVALGRFSPKHDGILDPATADLAHALPDGILFLDTTLEENDQRDSLGHPATAPLHTAWAAHRRAISTNRTLRAWLALDFFKDVHKGMYENRPIHWPLSSKSRTFVAWVNIHRFTEQTLRILLADHLHPTLTRIDGERNDLRAVRDGADKKAARAAEKRYDFLTKARNELEELIHDVEPCEGRGAPPTDDKCPKREQDARYAPDLDDGVMINSAALWPLLEPQWKDPKKGWGQLAKAAEGTDYDWSHLAMRYWPSRVDEKCRKDPSLGVAHGCFWRYHPARAWAWELRLQSEIGPDFRITEAPYRPGGRDLGDQGDGPHRAAFLRDKLDQALAAIEREALRRMGRSKARKRVPEIRILEAGLWSRHPEDIWAMELRLADKQGADFRLLAPDEPVSRADFEAQHPRKVEARRQFLSELVPQLSFLADEEEAEDADGEDVDGDEDDGEDDSA
jgi:Eco57I restriction-modification methylase